MVLLYPSTFVDNPFLTRQDVVLGLKGRKSLH